MPHTLSLVADIQHIKELVKCTSNLAVSSMSGPRVSCNAFETDSLRM